MLDWAIIILMALAVAIILDGLRHARNDRRAVLLHADPSVEGSPDSLGSEPGPSASPEKIMLAMEGLAKSTSMGVIPDVAKALKQPAGVDNTPTPHPVLKARCDACLAALSQGHLFLKVVDSEISVASLQEALSKEGLIYDIDQGMYHATDAAGLPAFSVKGTPESGALPAPWGATNGHSVSSIELMLPEVEPSARVNNYVRMVGLAYSIMAEHSGRLLDDSGSTATRQSLEYTHDGLVVEARRCAMGLARYS